jgi:type II secretory ATPase GspE/PulE/Tfp pilus assembly ATPase PilB-like protein
MDNPTANPEDQKPLVRVNKDRWVPMSSDNVTLIAGTLIAEAIKRRGTEIHVDRGPDKVTIRYLVDGVLREGFKLPRLIHSPLVYCLRRLGRPTLIDRLNPKNRHYVISYEQKEYDLDVTFPPTVSGEVILIRVTAR